jgi:diacylglycerol kinase family enzyme
MKMPRIRAMKMSRKFRMLRRLRRKVETPLGEATRARPIEIVVTPSSGSGQAMTTALELRKELTDRGYRTSLEMFTELESLTRWAETDDRQFSALICVGGDGTQSATAAAAVRRQVPFLSVSHGFGNLFARAFHHPRRAKDVLDLLMYGEVIPSDIGLLNGELFLCQQAYGLIAEVQEAVEGAGAAPRTRWQRWLSYYRAALQHFRETPLTSRRVVVDGRLVAVDAALVIVANVETYGPWLPLTPGASPIDGLFDVFVLRGETRRAVFRKLLRRHLRIPGHIPGTELCRGQQVTVSGLGSTWDQLDVQPGVFHVVVSSATAARLRQQKARHPDAARRIARQVA